MSYFCWITCFWPGLSRLWLRGQWLGLAVAAGFGVLLNVSLTFQFMWSESFPLRDLQIIWWCTGLCWTIGLIDGTRVTFYNTQQAKKRDTHDRDYTNQIRVADKATHEKQNDPEPLTVKNTFHRNSNQPETDNLGEPSNTDGLFLRARNQYLKGNWYETESLIQQMLLEYPADLEARLLYIALLRHTDRSAEALIEITEIQKQDGAAKWDFEITRELQLLEQVLSETNQTNNTTQAA